MALALSRRYATLVDRNNNGIDNDRNGRQHVIGGVAPDVPL